MFQAVLMLKLNSNKFQWNFISLASFHKSLLPDYQKEDLRCFGKGLSPS